MTIPAIEPKGSPLATLLPAFTFLLGPNGAGKTTLANLLFDEIKHLQARSFAAPLRLGTTGLFWEGDINVDLSQPNMKALAIPGFPTHTHRDFINALGDFIRAFLGHEAIGIMALRAVQEDADYFQRTVFDDARRATDIRPIVAEFGSENCLFVELRRGTLSVANQAFAEDSLPASFPKIRHVIVQNDAAPIAMLTNLTTALKDTAS